MGKVSASGYEKYRGLREKQVGTPDLDKKYVEVCGPHCDSKILHAPGECKFCDKYPELQYVRDKWWRINFTGQNDPDKLTCPAEVFRPADIVNRWHGNRPVPD